QHRVDVAEVFKETLFYLLGEKGTDRVDVPALAHFGVERFRVGAVREDRARIVEHHAAAHIANAVTDEIVVRERADAASAAARHKERVEVRVEVLIDPLDDGGDGLVTLMVELERLRGPVRIRI